MASADRREQARGNAEATESPARADGACESLARAGVGYERSTRLYVGARPDAAGFARIVLGCAADWGVKGADARLRKTDLGKPYFANLPGMYLSLSHSEGLWALALSTAEVGVDVQAWRECRAAAVAKRFFHPLEAAFVAAGPPERFFSVWTAKESYVKYTGEGITETFGAFSSVEDGRLRGSLFGAPLRFVSVRLGYTLCVCGGAPGMRVIFL